MGCAYKVVKMVNGFSLRSFLPFSDCTEVGIACELG